MNNAIALTGGAAVGLFFMAIVAGSWPLFFAAVVFAIISLVLSE